MALLRTCGLRLVLHLRTCGLRLALRLRTSVQRRPLLLVRAAAFTAWATQLAIRHLRPEGYVVASENCWPDPIVASVAGKERSVGLVMSKIGVALWKPGEVQRGMEKGGNKGHDVFRAGEHDNRITPRVTELAEIMKAVDGSFATDNLWGERWCKLSANAMGNPVQAMSGLGSLDIARGRSLLRDEMGDRGTDPGARAGTS